MKNLLSSIRHKSQEPSPKFMFLPFAIILLVSLGVYLNTLSNGFVYDDNAQVLQNGLIRDIRYIPDIFSGSAQAFLKGITSNYYRPLMNMFYMLSYYLFGLKAWGFHLVNMVFHAANSVMVFLLAERLIAPSAACENGVDNSPPLHSRVPALIAALLFATHPIHTEAVSWIAGVPDLTFTLFCLLSFYLYIRSENHFGFGYLGSVFFFLVAALCKETALVLPIIIITYDCLYEKEEKNPVAPLKRVGPYLAVAGVYFVVRLHALGGVAPLTRHTELSTYQYVINIFPLFAGYLEKLLLPIHLNAHYVLHPIRSLSEPRGLLAVLVTAIFIVCCVVAIKKSRATALGFLLVLIPLLPVFYIRGLGENTFAERYLYLPSFGFVLLVGLAIRWASGRFPRAVAGLLVLCIVCAGLYSLGTIRRNAVWKDDYTLFSDTVKKSPDGFIPHDKLGNVLLSRNETDRAIEQFKIALSLNLDDLWAYSGLGRAYLRKGMWDQAIQELQFALMLKQDTPEDHFNLGQAFMGKGLPERAAEEYQAALNLNPSFTAAHYFLGTAYEKMELAAKAAQQYALCSRQDPKAAYDEYNKGLDLFDKGARKEAIEHYQTALRLDPNFADAHNNLGTAYGSLGAIDKAIEQFRIAVKLKPDNEAYRQNLAKARQMEKAGRTSEER